jgi:hypothetical protein
MPYRRVLAGAVALVGGAALVDVGFRLGLPAVERAGNAAMILASLGLAFLPKALGATPRVGRRLYWAGLALATVVDVPALIDPADLRAGRVLGFPAMLLMTVGLIVLWRRVREPALLVAALWFFVQLPPNVFLFIIPDQRPSFVLQVTGCAVALAVAARRAQRSRIATTPWPPAAQMEMSPRP